MTLAKILNKTPSNGHHKTTSKTGAEACHTARHGATAMV
jgi:hypothetical protein